jgi:hypothetical protein
VDAVADPMALLGALNPVPDEAVLPATSTYVPAQRTLHRILEAGRAEALALATGVDVGAGGGGPSGGARRRWRLVAGGALVVASLVTAAAVWVVTRPAGNPTRVACFAAADLDADTAVVAASAGGDPITSCEEVWRNGSFRGWGAVPPLAACVLASGTVGVFPGDPSLCDRLGLARHVAEGADWDARVGQLVDGLTSELASPACVDVAVAADLVRERLDQLDLDGWTLIAPATVAPDRPCASVAFDPPAKTITLVPVPVPSD